MRVLTFTSLYPNGLHPRHGIFVKNRMDYFDRIEGTSRKVIAPVQYVPLLGLLPNSRFHQLNQIPQEEQQGDVPVYHPRYMTIPGTNIINVADAMAKAAHKILPEIYKGQENFELIDAHYLYPDGVAAFRLAKKLSKPLILTARGSDVNFWLDQPDCKDSILQAIDYAHKVICVSHALKDRLIQHGVDQDKLTVIMNGVDNIFFQANNNRPQDNRGEYLLTVGNLVPLKGHAYILHALAELPQEKLTIIGAGELDATLRKLAEQLKISDRVSFLPHIAHKDLPAYYVGAKCTILMSSSEGMPNVVLESLACGTPVIATNVGGIPEVITENNGILLSERTSDALTEALKAALQHNWDRPRISQDMTYLDWTETARKLQALFSEAL
ncbi:MAG: glycosyltransferase [Emcibacter sp.]|nr:glycosyltransferase [Emcibacter sp.]